MKLKKILFAEDNPKDAELTILALKEANILNEIVHVRNGEEALDYIYYRNEFKEREKGNPVVIILDLKMPKVDGIQALKIIKSDENIKSIPVVILTSSREETDLVNSYNLGTNAYVVKPVDFNKFIECVKNLGIFWVLMNQSISD
jgi:CheY-like chemotaxis protein